MNDVITFFIWILDQLWTLIISSWIVAFPVLLAIFSWIVNLIVSARQSS